MTVELGDVVRDTISGYEGVVIGIHSYLYGCRRMSVQSQKLHDGKPIESHAFDEPQLELVAKNQQNLQAIPAAPVRTGGPARSVPTERSRG